MSRCWLLIVAVTSSLATNHSAKREELRSLGEQVDLFKEAVTAKDQVVVDLTNKV